MRQQLIEALTYPRLLIKKLIEEHNYQHNNMFEATGERCHHCTDENCGWETCFQDFVTRRHQARRIALQRTASRRDDLHMRDL